MNKAEKIEMVDVDLIIPWNKNANKHSDEQIERLGKLIQHSGFRDPLFVSKRSGYLIYGHGRLLCTKKIGLKEVPVIYQDFKDEAEEFQFSVSHNAIAKDSWSTLDLSMVNAELPELGPDFDLDMLGIKNFTLDLNEDFDMDDELSDDLNKKYILEITFPNGEELADIRDDLLSRGYIVKEK